MKSSSETIAVGNRSVNNRLSQRPAVRAALLLGLAAGGFVGGWVARQEIAPPKTPVKSMDQYRAEAREGLSRGIAGLVVSKVQHFEAPGADPSYQLVVRAINPNPSTTGPMTDYVMPVNKSLYETACSQPLSVQKSLTQLVETCQVPADYARVFEVEQRGQTKGFNSPAPLVKLRFEQDDNGLWKGKDIQGVYLDSFAPGLLSVEQWREQRLKSAGGTPVPTSRPGGLRM